MKTNSSQEARLDKYSEAFDYYLEQNVLPEGLQNDILGEYLKNVLEDPGNKNLCKTDDIWMELIKTSILKFFAILLPQMDALEKEKKKEMEYIDRFASSDIQMKRRMWYNTEAFIAEHYSSNEVNMDGYIYMMKNTDCSKDVIFESMAIDWREACKDRIDKEQQKLIKSNQKWFEDWVLQAGKNDFETIKQTAMVFHHYPSLKEIIQRMGREKEKEFQEEDTTIVRQIPLLLEHSSSHEEVDGIKISDDLSLLLPSEIALLNDTVTESLFYHKYTGKQLQSFASKPPSVKHEKTEKKRSCKPRLQEGPIIVSIDTSGSMEGEPEEIAKSLLVQILQMAKKKKRKCFLITFSVRTKLLEISKPGHWHKVKEFLKKRFTGGTDGEQMLKDIIDALNSKDYNMADALIISDFEFSRPLRGTQIAILKERAKGTRFYGLQIGREYNEYEFLLDRIWKI